ncbi:hypothetical protein I8751_13675 [Nostocaceae cyanobacterium CENA357]|uniref:DUF927 domain-containing protein n=1 Tax=Atlanticothrix silvestris CENA357 TaxID=1725252 RepID=A0A8J7HJ99_9CYAN|nr:hypothetical protein [Atlanticothrix silvestris]MBH8553405.1 hypothetical protein [Atlanticothrix silvestris CENA357]
MESTTVYLDPNEFYRQEMDSWEELWDEDMSLYGNVHSILSQAVLLPQKDLMLPIVATYLLIPSKWARVLPILFSWGGKGSGKSTTAIFAAKLHGINSTFSATDTFSAIRNALDNMRWIDPNDKDMEKEGAILPWDNIHTGTLKKDERIYQMLLFGYSRATDKISIAQTDGTNREFFVFSPKIISSVDDLHLNPDFEELHRRLLIIPHKSYEAFTLEEKKAYEDFDISTDRIDLDSIHWDGISDKFLEFWNNPENCKLYAKYRTILTKKGKKEFKHNIKSEQWLVSIDLIVTGLVTGAWRSIPEAINHLEAYWEYANKNIFNQSTATIEHLEVFIEEEVGVSKQLNKQLEEAGRTGLPLRIDPQKLKTRLSYHKDRGELDIIPNQPEIIRLMNVLGWRLTAKGWIEKK